MATKTGAGGEQQPYDESTGRYGYDSRKSYTIDRAAKAAGLDKMSTSELKARQTIDLESVAETIPLEDEQLPQSLSAKWSNYDIAMPDGSVAHFQEGGKLHHKEVIAGKGVKRKIDEVEGLVSKYGGNLDNWIKVKAFGKIVRANGEIEEREIHWYEEPTVGKVKLKVKKR